MLRTRACVCVLFVLACCALPMAAQQGQPQVTTYYACVNNSTGAIRIVSKTTVCKSTEHKINWNQVGPQGPQGAQGLQGAQGPQGPQGPAGISVGYSWTGNAGGASVAGFPGTVVAQSNPVGIKGVYYINATALVVENPAEGIYCYTSTVNNGGGIYGNQSGTNVSFNLSSPVTSSVAVADTWFIGAGDAFQLWCYTQGDTNTSHVYDSLSTATLIDSPDSMPKNQRHSGESTGITGPVK